MRAWASYRLRDPIGWSNASQLAKTVLAAVLAAVVLLTTGYLNSGEMLAARLEDTGIGIAVGLLVNLLVWPPLRDRAAARQIDAIDDRVGELLTHMTQQLRGGSRDVDGWIARADELDSDVDRAWGVLGEARESGRFNPRRATAGRMNAAEGFVPILNRLAQAIAETRSMAHTIRVARAPEEWDRSFREPWLNLLSRCGAAVAAADRAALAATRADLTVLADCLHVDEVRGLWPVYGALLVNLRNILDALDAVAEAQPVQIPSSPAAPRQPVA